MKSSILCDSVSSWPPVIRKSYFLSPSKIESSNFRKNIHPWLELEVYERNKKVGISPTGSYFSFSIILFFRQNLRRLETDIDSDWDINWSAASCVQWGVVLLLDCHHSPTTCDNMLVTSLLYLWYGIIELSYSNLTEYHLIQTQPFTADRGKSICYSFPFANYIQCKWGITQWLKCHSETNITTPSQLLL